MRASSIAVLLLTACGADPGNEPASTRSGAASSTTSTTSTTSTNSATSTRSARAAASASPPEQSATPSASANGSANASASASNGTLAYRGDPTVGPCNADRDCTLVDACGVCEPLLVGVNFGGSLCTDRQGSGCGGRKAACALSTHACIVR